MQLPGNLRLASNEVIKNSNESIRAEKPKMKLKKEPHTNGFQGGGWNKGEKGGRCVGSKDRDSRQ